MTYMTYNADVHGMALAGRIAAETLDYIGMHIKDGITTDRLNELAHNFMVERGAVPAPLNYNGFPKSICVSVNDIAVHGIPSDYVLKHGDMLNIDVTVIKNGYHGDTSRMFVVGESEHEWLSDHTMQCMYAGIMVVRNGAKYSDVAQAILDEHVRLCKENDYPSTPRLIKSVVGHGIGEQFHTEPLIPHYTHESNLTMRTGKCFTIEPCFSAGSDELVLQPDGWSKRTKDGSVTAQWEHTIRVTDDGFEILTLNEVMHYLFN